MKEERIRFETLDALRGLAAIIVAVLHASARLPGLNSDWPGYLAVDFFLVLSGFVLSHSYLYRKEAMDPLGFIGNRIARLYPLHIFTLLTFLFAYVWSVGEFPEYRDGTVFTLVQNLTLTHNIGLNPRGTTYNFPSWSISVEFWVNVVFVLFITRKTRSSALFGLALVGTIVIYNNTGHLDTHAKNYFHCLNSGMTRGFVSFFLGILSYRMYLFYKDYPGIRRWGGLLEWVSLFVVGVLALARDKKFSGNDMFCPFVFMFVVFAFGLEHGAISRWLKNLRYLGEISYSLYLNQVTLLIVVCYAIEGKGVSTAIVLPLYLVLLIVYSHCTYQWLEKPVRIWGRGVLAGLRSQ